MLRRKIILVGVVAVLTLLLACRGEPTPSPTKAATPPAVQPAPTEPPATLPQATAKAHRTAAQVRISQPTQPFTPTIASTGTPSPTPIPASTSDSAGDVAAIRQMVAKYWEAFNEYDVDLAVTMLEPSYRAQEEELIRDDIGWMKLFRVTLDVSEKTPPTINDDGDYETYLSIKTPIDTRTVLMVFGHIKGQWWIVYSNPVEE